MKDAKNEVPNGEWNNHALLDYYAKNAGVGEQAHVADIIVARFRETVTGQDPAAFVLLSDSGRWARGTTLLEAAQNITKEGARKTDLCVLCLVLNDTKPYVDQMGAVNYSAKGTYIRVGLIGTLGGLLRAKPREKGGF